MEYVTLYNGIRMPMAGFGTWDVRGEEGLRILKDAIDAGYRLFDTAEMYRNEEIVGKAVRDSGIPREEFFVETKISHACASAAETLKAVEARLGQLGLDYADLILIHEPYRQAEEMYRGLEQALEKGMVRAAGISNFMEKPYRALLSSCRSVPAVNQIESHVYYPQQEMRDLLKSSGTAMQSWGSFTEGKRNIFAEEILNEIGAAHGKTAGQTALRYLIQNGICVIPKSQRRTRMEENINIFDFELSADEMKRIGTMNERKSLFGWYGNHWM